MHVYLLGRTHVPPAAVIAVVLYHIQFLARHHHHCFSQHQSGAAQYAMIHKLHLTSVLPLTGDAENPSTCNQAWHN
jgi:hypothetical protein